LDFTLKSVIPTVPHENIVVLDDCSQEEVTKKYLFTNETINKDEYDCDFSSMHGDPQWIKHVGDLLTPDSIVGIDGKVAIIRPEEKKGDLGGVFWCTNRLFEDNPSAPGVILIEADMVFNANWYEETLDAVSKCLHEKGPNGDHLGLFSCYNRRGNKSNCPTGWQWRSLARVPNTNNWRCGNGLGGVMFYITRQFYESSREEFTQRRPMKRSGDTAIQGLCAIKNFSIASTNYSCCQHIGVASSTWGSRKGWRYCKNFKKPFIVDEELFK
jgi:hypothetical protein